MKKYNKFKNFNKIKPSSIVNIQHTFTLASKPTLKRVFRYIKKYLKRKLLIMANDYLLRLVTYELIQTINLNVLEINTVYNNKLPHFSLKLKTSNFIHLN